ncbi:MAG: P-loop NTPase [Actinobacteria bacterium]|nr:P-loop NTPase [Actinomycetota bacterium]
MLLDEFFDPKILIVSGKGGVGKTTVSAALAIMAAKAGHRVCIAEVDEKGTLPAIFGSEGLGYEPSKMCPGIWGLRIIPEESLAEYLRVQYHMKRISKAFTSTHFVDYITTAAPGLKDILILGKIWYLEQERTTKERFDTIVVDAPAAGHMLTFLSAPSGLSDALRVGPVRRQADWLVQMLRDPKRARVHLVTLPEEMPVSETLETTRALEERLEIAQGPLFANAVYSELFTPQEEKKLKGTIDRAALRTQGEAVGLALDDEDFDALFSYARFLRSRRSIQETHLRNLRAGTGEPVIELPFLFSAGLALPDVENLADVIEEKVEKL